jgi:GTP-binding protein HflX
LVEIGAGNIPTVLVLNKVDKIKHEISGFDPEAMAARYRQHGFAKVVFVSAYTKENIPELKQIMLDEIKRKHLAIYPNFVTLDQN